MTSAAQDEFNTLMNSQSTHLTSHPEDRRSTALSSDDDTESNLSDTSNNNNGEPEIPPAIAAAARPNTNLSRDRIPRTRFAANTGPKGVIADAQNFRAEQRLHRLSRRSLSGAPAAGLGYGNGEHWGDGREVLSEKTQLGRDRKGAGFVGSEEVDEEDEDGSDFDDEDEDEDEDDGFMSEWRRNRLLELQSGMRDPYEKMRNKTRRTWSGMPTVDANRYLDAVEKSPVDTVVVVYVYDDQSEVSAAIESSLRDLIPSYPHVRFVRLHFLEAEMEPAGVPALLAYRGGDMFASLVPLVDEIPDDADLCAETLETVFRRRQILI